MPSEEPSQGPTRMIDWDCSDPNPLHAHLPQERASREKRSCPAPMVSQAEGGVPSHPSLFTRGGTPRRVKGKGCQDGVKAPLPPLEAGAPWAIRARPRVLVADDAILFQVRICRPQPFPILFSLRGLLKNKPTQPSVLYPFLQGQVLQALDLFRAVLAG